MRYCQRRPGTGTADTEAWGDRMTARTQTRRLVVAMAVALTTAALAAVSLAATASAATSAATDRTDVGSIAKLPTTRRCSARWRRPDGWR